MEFKIERDTYGGYGGREAWVLVEKSTDRPLLFPNNDMIMFVDKESAEKFCDLINNKAV